MVINKEGMVFVVRTVCLLFFFTLSSCSGSQNRVETRGKKSEIPLETYIQINRRIVAEQQKEIEHYIVDQGLDMQQTETGLWYNISHAGSGDVVEKGQIVTLNYTVQLLDGTLCYSSLERGPKVFKVGQGGVESGLEEGVLMLKKGSKATFIMPPHLAHGMVGDDENIPQRAIIRYEVEVLEVK